MKYIQWKDHCVHYNTYSFLRPPLRLQTAEHVGGCQVRTVPRRADEGQWGMATQPYHLLFPANHFEVVCLAVKLVATLILRVKENLEGIVAKLVLLG